MMSAIWGALVLEACTARVNLEYLSGITITYRFPCVVLRTGLKISVALNSSGLHDADC